MTQFVAQFATTDGRRANLYSWCRGEGSARSHNLIIKIAEHFAHGDGTILSAPPPEAKPLFEVFFGVSKTRHGSSSYTGVDYRRYPDCPQNVCEAGMEIYEHVRHVLRKARNRQRAEDEAKKQKEKERKTK